MNLTAKDIPRLRLLNQQLLQSSFTAPGDVVRWMGAVQAQDYPASLRAIGVRLQGAFREPERSTFYEETEAAFRQGGILRTHVLRPTWHLVTPEDIRWMLELTGPRIKSQTRARDRALGLTEADFEKGNAVFLQALRGGCHLLREELAGKFEDAGLDTSGYRLAHFLMRAELDAVICSGTPHGKKQTYALLSERAPQAKRFDRETSLLMLAKRYFTSRGPATLKDFIWWSGLTSAEARQAMMAADSEILSADIEGKTYYFHRGLEEAARTAKFPPNTVHRLPAFDEYLIAYADRTAVLAAEHTSKAITSNGIFRPTILRNGLVVGTWKSTGKQTEEAYF